MRKNKHFVADWSRKNHHTKDDGIQVAEDRKVRSAVSPAIAGSLTVMSQMEEYFTGGLGDLPGGTSINFFFST